MDAMEDDLFGQPNELLGGLGSVMSTTNAEGLDIVEEIVVAQTTVIEETLLNSVSSLGQSIEDTEMSFGGAYVIFPDIDIHTWGINT